MKRILLLTTGGTIASRLTDEGLAPGLDGENLARYLGGLPDSYDLTVRDILHLDSSNIQPEEWRLIAQHVYAARDGFDGIVISHGTDTMAYTAAGLSYLVQGCPKPIVLTGAQKPIGFETTDSKQNLRDAVTVAASDMAGVMLVFNGKIILGTRARKTRSKSFEAFSSINYPLLGMVRDGRIIRYIRPEARAVPQFYDTVNPKVALMKLIPGADCGAAAYLLERNDALIIESFGVGGLPTYKAGDYYDTVKAGLDAGKTVVMTTQVENEGSDLAVYHVGSSIKRNLPILEAYDMTTEAVCAKLMWILGQTTDRKWVEELFYTPVACDILAGK